MVVLPLVPVTPTSSSAVRGLAEDGGGERASASRASGTWSQGAPGVAGCSEATADAPFLRAASTNWLPSVARPLMATKSAPAPRLARVVRDGGDRRVAVAGKDAPRAGARPARARFSGILSRAGGRTSSRPRWPCPASGVCSTTRPDPRSSTIRPRRAAEVAPSRADEPAQVGHRAGLVRAGRRARRGDAGRRADRRRGARSPRAAAVARSTRSGSSGGTASRRSAGSAMRAKSGAATSPPSLAGPRGVSSETRTTSAGREAGTKPTNEATWSIIE